MDTLILRMRADTLKANLDEVVHVVEFLKGRTRHLTELREASNALQAKIAECHDGLKHAKRTVEDIPLSGDSALEKQKAALDKFKLTKGHLDEAATQLADLTASFTQLSRRPMRIAKNVTGTLRRTLANEARGLLDALTEVYRKIEAAEQPGTDDDEQRDLIRQAWSTLSDVEARLPELFSEYVEFLGGLALRDAGRDAGICRVVDKLMTGYDREVDQNPWRSLSIPGFQERISVDKTNIIRLGFTDWSLGDDFSHPAFWSIPLTAHQFGLLLASNDSLPDYVDIAMLPEWLRHDHGTILADAFATYTLGLAYGCAEILLRLDPLQAPARPGPQPVGIGVEQPARRADHAGLRSAQIRAAIVREMLEHLANVDNDYANGVLRLTELWDEALSLAGPDDDPVAPVPANDEEAEQLARFVEGLRRFFDFVSNRETDFAYTAEMYGRVLDWRRALSENDLASISVHQPAEPGDMLDEEEYVETRRSATFDNLRHLLNASWVARLFEPARTETIQRNAWQLWQKMTGEDRASTEPTLRGMGGLAEAIAAPDDATLREPTTRTAPRGQLDKASKAPAPRDPKPSTRAGGVK